MTTTVRSHTRRTTGGRFISVKTHSRVATVRGVKGKFLLSRAPWTVNPSGYLRKDKSIRIPRTGQVYKGGKVQPKREVKGHHYYGAGR